MANSKSKLYLVDSSVLPEIFTKVTEAKELLETGEAATVADAVNAVGISRSAFYKYKDAVTPFQNMRHGNIITFHIVLRDQPGVLSAALAVVSSSGANILTINQSIPTNGTAFVTISVETGAMRLATEELMTEIKQIKGVLRMEALAG